MISLIFNDLDLNRIVYCSQIMEKNSETINYVLSWPFMTKIDCFPATTIPSWEGWQNPEVQQLWFVNFSLFSPTTITIREGLHTATKTHITMIGKRIPPRWTNRCEVKCNYMYDVFHHGHTTVIIRKVVCYLPQRLV